MISMLCGFLQDVQAWIKSWDTTTFVIIVIALVLFLGLSTVGFIKKAVSDKPAVKISKILVIALLIFLIIYICSVH